MSQLNVIKMTRNCPICDKELIYKNKFSYMAATRIKGICQSCAAKKIPKKSKSFYEKVAWDKTSDINKQIIINHPNLTKNCPVCNYTIKYKNKISLIRSVCKNTKCASCVQIELYKTGKLKSWNKGKKLSKHFRSTIKKSWKKTRKDRVGINHPFYGKVGPMYGKTHSQKTKEKQRMSHIKYLKTINKKYSPNYNKKFCKYADKFNGEYDTKIIHAENTGEFMHIGYFADGYIQNKNIWIEYDEPKHFFGGKLRPECVIRQKNIQESLNCKFIRIKCCNSYKQFCTQLNSQL
jgi:hypothetical protein